MGRVNSARVAAVLDGDYGENLSKIAARMSVWILDSDANTAAATEWWEQHPNSEHMVTTFKEFYDFAGLMDDIELHHGNYSQDVPFRELETFGLALTEDVQQILFQYGFSRISNTIDGFIATRSCEPEVK